MLRRDLDLMTRWSKASALWPSKQVRVSSKSELIERAVMPIIEHTTLPEFKCENKDSLHFNANTRTRRRTMQGCQRGNDHVRSSTWIAAVKGFEHQQSVAHENGDRQTRGALGTAVLATPSTRRIALQPASRKLALPQNTRGMEGATSHKQAAWQNVHTATPHAPLTHWMVTTSCKQTLTPSRR